MAALLEQGQCVGRQALFHAQLVRRPLVVHARCGGGFGGVHSEVNRVHQRLQHHSEVTPSGTAAALATMTGRRWGWLASPPRPHAAKERKTFMGMATCLPRYPLKTFCASRPILPNCRSTCTPKPMTRRAGSMWRRLATPMLCGDPMVRISVAAGQPRRKSSLAPFIETRTRPMTGFWPGTLRCLRRAGIRPPSPAWTHCLQVQYSRH